MTSYLKKGLSRGKANFLSSSHSSIDKFKDINRNTVIDLERTTSCLFLKKLSWRKNGKELFNIETEPMKQCLACKCGACCSCETNPNIVPENLKPSWLKFVLSCNCFIKLLNIICLPFSLVSCCLTSNYAIRSTNSSYGTVESVFFCCLLSIFRPILVWESTIG